MLELLGSSQHHLASLCLVGSLHFAGRLTSILQLVWMVGCCLLQHFPNIKKIVIIVGILYSVCCSNCRTLSHAKCSLATCSPLIQISVTPLYNCFSPESILIHQTIHPVVQVVMSNRKALKKHYCERGGTKACLILLLLHKQMHDRRSIAESLHACI